MPGQENQREHISVAAVGNGRRSQLRSLLVGAAVAARNDRGAIVANSRRGTQTCVRERVVELLCATP